MKRFFLLLLLVSLYLPALAQNAESQIENRLRLITPSSSVVKPSAFRTIHVSERLNVKPEVLQALVRFQEARKAGVLPAHKKATTRLIGEKANFNVLINVVDDERVDWVSKEFTLKASSSEGDPAHVDIWVETGELDNGNIADSDVAGLREALINRTGSLSYNPNAGIIANNNAVFGNPPDYDGDGRLDILIYDITEGTDDCCILGYVIGTDLDPNAANGEGNQADVLYLDSNPGGSELDPEQLLDTASHEYQHLIHYNYDTQEFTFINEGLSEYAEVLNGFYGRSMTYITDPDDLNHQLLDWRSDQDITTVDKDYQRAGLFTAYFADRLGVEAAGSITRTTNRGPNAYRQALANTSGAPSLDKMVLDFHTTNLLSYLQFDDRYAYEGVKFQYLKAAASDYKDGRVDTETPQTQIAIQQGGAVYLVWDKVSDIKLSFDTQSSSARSSIRSRVVLELPDGTLEVRDDVSPQEAQQTFSGSYNRVVLILTGVTFELSTPIQVKYAASWQAPDLLYTSQDVSYGGNAAINYILSGGLELVTKITNPLPTGAILNRIRIPAYYYSQFGNDGEAPPETARDYVVNIRKVKADGSPGDVILSFTQNDTRPYQPVYQGSTSVEREVLDLYPYADQLTNLPESFFVGFQDVGTDVNEIILVTSSYATENRSYIGDPVTGSWRTLWSVNLSGGASLNKTIIPIQAEFLVPADPSTAVEDGELPEDVTLYQNYPNPFNPSTTISYSLPAVADVELEVYDIMGRRITSLVRGMETAGLHEITLDTRNWASGMYVYRLRAAGQQFTRKMLLVK